MAGLAVGVYDCTFTWVLLIFIVKGVPRKYRRKKCKEKMTVRQSVLKPNTFKVL